MTLNERFTLTLRIGACAVAGSLAGFLAWAIGPLGLGSLLWAGPLVIIAALFFGLPSLGILMAIGLVFGRSIRRHTVGWCMALPLVAMAAWRAYDRSLDFPADGMALVALCAVASSALFLAWDRYLVPPRVDAAVRA